MNNHAGIGGGYANADNPILAYPDCCKDPNEYIRIYCCIYQNDG